MPELPEWHDIALLPYEAVPQRRRQLLQILQLAEQNIHMPPFPLQELQIAQHLLETRQPKFLGRGFQNVQSAPIFRRHGATHVPRYLLGAELPVQISGQWKTYTHT